MALPDQRAWIKFDTFLLAKASLLSKFALRSSAHRDKRHDEKSQGFHKNLGSIDDPYRLEGSGAGASGCSSSSYWNCP
jgi:hypothetical protein